MSRNWICRDSGHSGGIRGDLQLIEIDAVGIGYRSTPERASREAIALIGRRFVGMPVVARRIGRVGETVIYRSIRSVFQRRCAGMWYRRQPCSIGVAGL